MYQFLPLGCRSLYTMKMTQEEILKTRRCFYGAACSTCYGCKGWSGGHLNYATEEIVVWEEAEFSPGLFDLFVDNKLLNVVFEWGEGSERQVIITRPRVDFEVVKLRETIESWPLTEEGMPLQVIKRYENCDAVFHHHHTLQRINISPVPNTAVDLSLNFAFQVEVEFETASEFRTTPAVAQCEHWDHYLDRYSEVIKTEVREECDEILSKTPRNPKYFCQSCSVDICKDCLQNRCNTHNVQWIGNYTFMCTCGGML